MSDFQNGDTAHWDAEQVRQSGPPVRRRKRRRINWFLYLLFVLLASMLLAGVGWLLASDLCAFNKELITVTVEITSEDNLGSVSKKLKDAGLIEYRWFFRLFGNVAHAEEKIGMGTYTLTTDMDYRALISSMHNSSGNLTGETVMVTIPEGYTVAQTIALLAKKGVNTQDALTSAAKTATFSYDFIDNTSEELSRLEGYLFPDTYEFYVGEQPSSALKRLIENFAAKVDDRPALAEAKTPRLQETVVIASLIEKETDGTDQAKIASVIYNRRNGSGDRGGTYGMLQIDAALLYALPDHTGPITAGDKQVDSPYNLYKYEGLPPTPIANPGAASIDAALSPESTGYYYYALGKDGKHRFFETFQEHQAFVTSDEYAG